MKHLKIAFLALLLITSFSNVTAQDAENPWMLTVGTNFIDISTNTDKTGGYFGLYDIGGNHVNVLWYPTYFALDRALGEKGNWALGLANTINRVDSPWGGSDKTYYALDLNAKYNFHVKWWNPFIYAGGGYNWIGSENGWGVNFGAGMNFWISDHVGIGWTSGWKGVYTSDDFELFQNSIGITWKFGAKKAVEIIETDSDGDGVDDCCDECPDVVGLAEFNGCADTDGDGIPDPQDECPEEAGPVETNGCPDMDGDGTPDKDDACPEVPGPKTNAGCPFKDTDKDGVIDLIDRCIETPGPADNDGCPVVEDVTDAINALARTLYFDTGKATFKDETIGRLDIMADILGNFPLAKFHIEGHADSTGSDQINDSLSARRANAVRDYLISKGVIADNLTAQGYGSKNPIDTNDTVAGKANNRRVEVKLAE